MASLRGFLYAVGIAAVGLALGAGRVDAQTHRSIEYHGLMIDVPSGWHAERDPSDGSWEIDGPSDLTLYVNTLPSRSANRRALFQATVWYVSQGQVDVNMKGYDDTSFGIRFGVQGAIDGHKTEIVGLATLGRRIVYFVGPAGAIARHRRHIDQILGDVIVPEAAVGMGSAGPAVPANPRPVFDDGLEYHGLRVSIPTGWKPRYDKGLDRWTIRGPADLWLYVATVSADYESAVPTGPGSSDTPGTDRETVLQFAVHGFLEEWGEVFEAGGTPEPFGIRFNISAKAKTPTARPLTAIGLATWRGRTVVVYGPKTSVARYRTLIKRTLDAVVVP